MLSDLKMDEPHTDDEHPDDEDDDDDGNALARRVRSVIGFRVRAFGLHERQLFQKNVVPRAGQSLHSKKCAPEESGS
jgi:hypothetical protein